jgi:hypothetical protein
VYFRTTNYFVVDKVGYDDDGIASRSETNNSLWVPSSAVAEVAQPFFHETKDYALTCMLSALSSDLNNCIIQPTFYKIKYDSAVIDTQELSSVSVSGNEFFNPLPVKIANIVNPLIVYNSRNNLHTLIATLYDVNNFVYLFQMFFDHAGDIIVSKGTRLINLLDGGVARTINWLETSSLNDFVFNNITINEHRVENGALAIYG